MSTRTLYITGPYRERERLLRSLFLTLSMSPRGERLWIQSPWITNFILLEGLHGPFRGLHPLVHASHLMFFQWLESLLLGGVDVRLIMRPSDEPHSARFRRRFVAHLGRDRLQIRENLHAKVLLTRTFLVSGSMNFTRSGLRLNEEHVEVTSDEAKVAQAAYHFQQVWEGASVERELRS